MKPGYKTTEFWLSISFQLGILGAALAEVLPAKYAALSIAVSNVAYAVSRGLAKKGA